MSSVTNANSIPSQSKLPEFINVPAFILQDERLNEGECLLYGFLLSFAINRKPCKMYNAYLARVFNKSIDTIKRRIKALEDSGLIQRHYVDGKRHLKVTIANQILEYPEEDAELNDEKGVQICTGGECKSAPGGVQICTTDIKSDIKLDIKEKHICEVETSRAGLVTEKKAVTKEKVSSKEVNEIIEYWKEVHNHPKAKIDDKRKNKVRAALKLFSKEDLMQAIVGCKRSPYHQGHNPGCKIHDSIDLILRDAHHIEQFIQAADSVIDDADDDSLD
jgi:hypothetical protein